jgi:hypothetical protein
MKVDSIQSGGKHAAYQRAGIRRHLGSRRQARTLQSGLFVRQWRRIANKKPPLASSLDQPLRQELVVGGHDGVRADALLPRAFTHRRQASTRRQQAVSNALGKARRQLVRE